MVERQQPIDTTIVPKISGAAVRTFLLLTTQLALVGCMHAKDQHASPAPVRQEVNNPSLDAFLKEYSRKHNVSTETLRAMIMMQNFLETKRIDAITGKEVLIAVNNDDYQNFTKYPRVSVHAGRYKELSLAEQRFVDELLQDPQATEFHSICRDIKAEIKD